MKKRVLSIILALVMVLPFVFTSCNTKSEEDKMKEIILGTNGETERALTLSLWIPTNVITIEGKTADLGELSQKERKELEKSYPEVYNFLLRVEAVESAINQELISRNYYTNIDIVPVYEEYYDKAVKDRFAYMSEHSNPGDMNQRGDSDEYKNDVVEEIVGDSTLYKLLYRPVSSEQLDIFLIRSYDDYANYIKSNSIIPLNSVTETKITVDGEEILLPATNYISSTGEYKSIYKYIRTEFLDKYEFGKDGLIYALPNNHLFAESYQCVLLDKDLVASYDGDIDLNTATSTADLLKKLKAFVEYSATQKDSDGNGYTGLVAGYNDIPGYIFADDKLMFASENNTDKISFIYNDPTYIEYIKMYKEFENNGLVSSTSVEGKKSAVQIIDINVDEIDNYEKDYVVYKALNPVVQEETLFSSMFAISTYSLDFDRSMKILFLLQSDSEIRTLLQYGIEDEDYVIITTKDENGDKKETISLKDTAYNGAFDIKYTGNSYYTFPGNNTQINDWKYVKGANLVTITGKFFNYANFAKYRVELSEEEKTAFFENYDELAALLQLTMSRVEDMTIEEFEAFLEVCQVNIIAKYDRLEELPNDIKLYQNTINENYGELESINKRIEELNPTIEEFNEKHNKLIEERDKLPDDSEERIQIKEQISKLKEEYKPYTDEYNKLFNEKTNIELRINNYQEMLNGFILEYNVTIPNELAQLKEKSSAAFELMLSREFSVISKTYASSKVYEAYVPPKTENGDTPEDTENTEQAE